MERRFIASSQTNPPQPTVMVDLTKNPELTKQIHTCYTTPAFRTLVPFLYNR